MAIQFRAYRLNRLGRGLTTARGEVVEPEVREVISEVGHDVCLVGWKLADRFMMVLRSVGVPARRGRES